MLFYDWRFDAEGKPRVDECLRKRLGDVGAALDDSTEPNLVHVQGAGVDVGERLALEQVRGVNHVAVPPQPVGKRHHARC